MSRRSKEPEKEEGRTSHLRTVKAFTAAPALVVISMCVATSALADPPPSVPGPGEPGYCGAHTDAMDCWADVSPPTPGEKAFVNDVQAFTPGDDDKLLQIARGICTMLDGGVATSYLVRDIADQLGVSQNSAVSIMNSARSSACYG